MVGGISSESFFLVRFWWVFLFGTFSGGKTLNFTRVWTLCTFRKDGFFRVQTPVCTDTLSLHMTLLSQLIFMKVIFNCFSILYNCVCLFVCVYI